MSHDIKLEFHFDFGSPNAYLTHLLVPAMEQRTGTTVTYVPVLLGGVFKATNNASPAVTLNGIKNKPEYQQRETERFLKKHNITSFSANPFFPVNTLQIMRGAVYAQSQDFYKSYIDEIYKHMWSEPKKMDDADVIRAAFEASGLPTDEIFAGMQDADVKKTLISNTERSVAMGTFGSPTFYAGDEPFFGKDKFRDFEEFVAGL